MWAKDPDPDPPDDDDERDPLLRTLITVGLSTLITALVTWGVDELRDRFGSKKPEPPKTPPPNKPS